MARSKRKGKPKHKNEVEDQIAVTLMAVDSKDSFETAKENERTQSDGEQIDGPVTAVEPVEPADGTAEDGDEEGAARAAEDAAEGEDEGEDEEGDDDQMAEPMVWAMEQLTKEQSAPLHDVLAELSKASVGTMTPLLQIRTLLAQTKRTPEELAKDAHSVEFVLGLVFCARPFKNFPQMDEEVEVSLRVEKAMQHLRHGRVADPGACKEAVEELKMDADALREVKEQSNFTNFDRIEKNIVVLERFLQLWGKGKAKKVQKKISEHFDAGALWVAVVEYLDRLDRSLGKTFMERVFDDIDAGRVPEHSHLGQLLKVREGYTYKADAGVPKQHTRATRGAAAIGAATFVPDELPAGWEEPPLKRAGRPPAPPPQPSAAAAAKPLPVARAPPAPTGAMAVALAATDAEKEAAAGLQDMVGDGAAGPSGHAGDKGVIPLEVLLQNYNGADTKQRAKSKGKMSAAQKRKAALAFEDDSDDSGSDFEEGEDKARAATRELRQTVKDAGKATEDPLEAARAAARGAGRRIGGAAKGKIEDDQDGGGTGSDSDDEGLKLPKATTPSKPPPLRQDDSPTTQKRQLDQKKRKSGKREATGTRVTWSQDDEKLLIAMMRGEYAPAILPSKWTQMADRIFADSSVKGSNRVRDKWRNMCKNGTIPADLMHLKIH